MYRCIIMPLHFVPPLPPFIASFIPRMRHSLLLIVAMNMVERKVSALQRESYSEKNGKHEQMLLKVANM